MFCWERMQKIFCPRDNVNVPTRMEAAERKMRPKFPEYENMIATQAAQLSTALSYAMHASRLSHDVEKTVQKKFWTQLTGVDYKGDGNR
mmetsp:Transcript_1746/g.3100  ORF Transcript_1746/g.3100 Transcript_1746/m.3100 type:complete len:89 (+) Transcript_1746:1000-1266(+)